MFGERSPPARRKSERNSTDSATSSRRRNMAFLRYGSSSERNRGSMNRTREHARQIAMKVSAPNDTSPFSIQSTSTFADFGSAFPDTQNSLDLFPVSERTAGQQQALPNHSRHTSANAPDDSSFSETRNSSMFDEDPFAPGARERAALVSNVAVSTAVKKQSSSRAAASRTAGSSTTSPQPTSQQQLALETDWPTGDNSMFSMPNNSSMQTKFTQPRTPSASPEPQVTKPANNSMATRMRVRTQLRQQGSSSTSRYQRSESDAVETTPPASPHSLKRYHSTGDFIGSRRTDHVAQYSSRQQHTTTPVVKYALQQQAAPQSAGGGRSISSNRSFAGSLTSVDSSDTPNLFDIQNSAGGFTFDAFGLDPAQINRDVSAAIQDMAGSSVGDVSFFNDLTTTDDFGKGGWDSPAGSRAQTPVETDGFVDGFRVNIQHPLHVRQSPVSTERSSLTSESSDHRGNNNNNADGINLFKEQAGFQSSGTRPRRVVRPAERTGAVVMSSRPYTSPTRRRGGAATMPSMPILDDHKSIGSPRNQHDVEFFDESSSQDDSGDQAVPNDGPDDDDDDPCCSDAGAAEATTTVPLEVNSKEKQQQRTSDSDTCPTESTAASSWQEEKKDDTPEKRVGDLRSRWEVRTESSPTGKQAAAVRQQEKPSPRPPEKSSTLKSQISRLESQQTTHSVATDRVQRTPGGSAAVDVNEKAATKSEAGAFFSSSTRNSQVSAILGKMDSRSPPPAYFRDTKSDVGASPMSPPYAKIQFRKSPSQIVRHHSSPSSSMVDQENHEQQQRDIVDEEQSPTMFGAKLRKTTTNVLRQPSGEQEGNDDEQQHQLQRDGVPRVFSSGDVSPGRKQTYRERREIELQKQKEEDTARQAEEESKHRELDVASLVKQRISANKKNALPLHELEVEESESFQERRNKLKPVPHSPARSASSSAFGSDGNGTPTRRQPPDGGGTPNRRRLPSRPDADQDMDIIRPTSPPRGKPESPQRRRQSNLVIEQERHHEEESLEPRAAVARLLMLQQLQQKQPSTLPTESDSVSHDERPHKQATPKATMMMLNAFLAGRESVASGDGGSVHTANESVGKGSVDRRASKDAPEAVQGFPALKNDPKYQRYFKMLSIGMPMEVVKHAMSRDGLDPSVMDGDHNKPVGVPLRLDPTFSKYFKMLNIGLPMEAVKHAMARDGLDPTVMDQDHDLPVTNTAKPVPKVEQDKDSHRRARMHWTTLRKVTSNSLWAIIDKEEALGNFEIDEKEFRELFQAERNVDIVEKKKPLERAKGATVRVIDPKRANNGGIILARLKMSHDEMADAVDRISDSTVTAEQIEHMIEYLPTKEERKALEAYMLGGGQDAAEKFDGLCECEKFMVSMMTVKHAKRKIRALLFKLQFETCCQDIQQDAFLVEGACDELATSIRLRQLLGFILEFGNRLNTAGNGTAQKAGAFTIDSLLKLRQAKAFDKKTTFLNFIVRMVHRTNEIVLNFKDDLPTVFKADKVFWDQCISDLEEVENQLENVRRISLYQARQAVAYRLRRKSKNRDEDEESLSDGEISLSLEEEVEALRATPIGVFTLSAIKYISALRNKVEETKRKYAYIVEYFGEEESRKQPHELFSTIVQFSREFDKEKDLVAKQQKKKLRDDRMRNVASNNSKSQAGKPPPYSPAPSDRLKTSSHQPTMSSVLNDIRRSQPSTVSHVDAERSREQHGSSLAVKSRNPPSGRYEETRYSEETLSAGQSSRSIAAAAMSNKASLHGDIPQQTSRSPARSDIGTIRRSNQEVTASPARSDSAAFHRSYSAPLNGGDKRSPKTAEARASVRSRRRMEQRRLLQEAGQP